MKCRWQLGCWDEIKKIYFVKLSKFEWMWSFVNNVFVQLINYVSMWCLCNMIIKGYGCKKKKVYFLVYE